MALESLFSERQRERGEEKTEAEKYLLWLPVGAWLSGMQESAKKNFKLEGLTELMKEDQKSRWRWRKER